MNAFIYKFITPNQKERKAAIYNVISKSEQQAQPNNTSEVTNNSKMNIRNEINEQTKLKEQFKTLFTRQGRLNDHEVKIELKSEPKVNQLKGRRNPIQWQEAVQNEIERLLEASHIEKVTEVTNKHFIQLVVITVQRDKNVST